MTEVEGYKILRTRGLTMQFGGVTAVDNVDLDLNDGELRCLLGPNGAGKSDLLQMPHRPADADQRRDHLQGSADHRLEHP